MHAPSFSFCPFVYVPSERECKRQVRKNETAYSIGPTYCSEHSNARHSVLNYGLLASTETLINNHQRKPLAATIKVDG